MARRIVVWVKPHVVDHLEHDSNEEANEDGDQSRTDVPPVHSRRGRIPQQDHDGIFSEHYHVVDEIAQSHVPVHEGHLTEHVDYGHDNVQEALLTATRKELPLL